MIKHYFIKYLYQPFSNNVVNLIRYVVRNYRLHNHVVLSPFASQAVQIIYACKDDDDKQIVDFLEVSLPPSSHAVATPRGRRSFLHHEAPRRRLRRHRPFLRSLFFPFSRQLDTVCALEARIASEFGFASLASSLQDIAVNCLLRDIVGSLASSPPASLVARRPSRRTLPQRSLLRPETSPLRPQREGRRRESRRDAEDCLCPVRRESFPGILRSLRCGCQ